jgi:branched-chain amino acid transport system substrate-binding protein
MYFAQVKKPSESTKPWDYYNMLGVIHGDQAFRPLAEGGCPLVAR